MIWRCCERFNVLPPGIVSNFEGNTGWSQALLLSYEQIREIEDQQDIGNIFGGSKKK